MQFITWCIQHVYLIQKPTSCQMYMYVSLSIRELVAILLESSELHSSDRIGRQGKKDQRPSSNSGPTLYRGVSATRAIDPSRDPLSRAIGDEGSRLGSMARVAETPR